ncbi:MAG: hypothetical protein R3344_03210 [Acidobacteriota bacterium]|nr:hypothetical protein [Acidobacteriota bacterium]
MKPAFFVVLFAATLAAGADELDETASRAGDPDLGGGVRSVAGEVGTLRGISLSVPPAAVRAPSEFRRVSADARVARVIGSERLDARGQAWEDIGLGSSASPAWLYRTLAADLAGIAFDPVETRILVDPERLTEADFAVREDEGEDAPLSLLMATGLRPDEPLIAHVLVHVLQSEREVDALPDTTDALLAHAAWMEGEANLVAGRFLFQAMGVDVEILETGLDISKVLDGALVSPALGTTGGVERELLSWVYLDGFDQASDRFRVGGWAAVGEAISRRRATRDVMHPDREVLEIAEIATPESGLPPEYELADRDVVGEQAIAALISHRSGKVNLGLISADGWAGDALFRWQRPGGGEGVTLWITRWVSEAEAADFEYGYGRALERWTGVAATAVGDPPTDHRFVNAGRAISLAREGQEVRVRVWYVE